MTNVPTWISRMSAIALATASMSAFAAAPNAPDYIMHKASVSLKVSTQGTDGKINKDTVKTKDLINILMGRSPDDKNGKDEKLGLVTGCDAEVDAVALVVYDKKTEEIVSDSDNIIVDIEAAVFETDKNGDLKKADLIGDVGDSEEGLLITGQVKYGKIGSGCAKDGDNKDYWDKDSVCAKNFKSKSVSGAELLGSEIVMSGKISAGSCQFAADSGIFPGIQFAISKSADMINGAADDNPVVESAGDTIGYDIKVTNLSNDETATNVVVDDIRAGVTVDCSGQTVLNAGSSMNCSAMYTVTQDDIDEACGASIGGGDATIGNFATVTADGTDDFGASEFVDVDCYGAPGDGDVMAISKTMTGVFCTDCGGEVGEPADAGDTIEYDIVVTNLSDAAQTGVAVTDVNPGVDVDCGGVTDLAASGDAGDEITCTASMDVTQADVDLACDRGGNIVNVAVVSSTESDPNSFAADEFVEADCGVSID